MLLGKTRAQSLALKQKDENQRSHLTGDSNDDDLNEIFISTPIFHRYLDSSLILLGRSFLDAGKHNRLAGKNVY